MYSNFEFLPISYLVYVENGRSTTATTLTFTTASTSGITWKAKVTQIECSRWFTSVLVCFTLLLNHVILRDKNTAMKTIFTYNGHFQLVHLITTELKYHMICYNSMPMIG